MGFFTKGIFIEPMFLVILAFETHLCMACNVPVLKWL
jgi:hypothetical protein